MQEKKRNYNIDFLRGIATLFIILIHTVWWSGTIYLPAWFSNICLLIDVPVFMFIAGISFNFVNSIIKNIKGIVIQWKKWLYFIIFYTLIIFIFFREQLIHKEVLSWITYVFPSSNSLDVVGGSIWFMFMYIKVTILCSIIICSINYFFKEKSLQCLITVLLFMLFIFLYNSTGYDFLFIDSYISFYSIVYLLGYILNNCKIKNILQLILYILITLFITLIVFDIYNYDITYIQAVKFPPTLPYLCISMFSIIIFWYLKDHLKINQNNKINYIGKNAIFFYFAQGISSSLIYFIYPHIPYESIIIKFIIMLLCNYIMAFIIAIFLIETYKIIDKIKLTKIKNAILPSLKKDN